MNPILMGIVVAVIALLTTSVVSMYTAEAKKKSKTADMIIHFTGDSDVNVKFLIYDDDLHYYKTIKAKTINLQDFNDKWLRTQDDDCCTLVISFKNKNIPTSHQLIVVANALDGSGFSADHAALIHEHNSKVRYVAYLGDLFH